MAPAWAFYSCVCMMLAFIATFFTVYFAPGAKGSGIPQLLGYMHGINIPDLFSLPILVVKSIGAVLAVTGGLCVGKEGPLAQIGSIIALYTIYLIPGFDEFHDDISKREFIVAGASAGLSCAFGAPFGATLLAYEMTTPNTFWKQGLIWKVLVTCVISAFTLSIFTTTYSGNYGNAQSWLS